MLSKEEILSHQDLFVGSQATDFGDYFLRHDEFGYCAYHVLLEWSLLEQVFNDIIINNYRGHSRISVILSCI